MAMETRAQSLVGRQLGVYTILSPLGAGGMGVVYRARDTTLAAYAEFAGKSLPTIYHWYNAAGFGRHGEMLTLSNMGTKGPTPAGSHGGLGPFGTDDMAGNVKEWTWNETETGNRRFILGGGWNEPNYMAGDYDAKEPFEGGHAPSRYQDVIKEILDWLDRYLGPVTVR